MRPHRRGGRRCAIRRRFERERGAGYVETGAGPAALGSDAWDGEGERWVAEPRKHAPGLDSLLSWAYRIGASRIAFQTGASGLGQGSRPQSHRDARRRWTRPSSRRSSTISMAPTAWRGCRAATTSTSAYEIAVSRTERLRFRLNATPTRTSRRDGGNIVLAADPRHAAVARGAARRTGILDAYRPREGMVIVSGATGSGKSTLIAGMTVAKLQTRMDNYNIVEGAAPIEFLLERVRSPSSTINQTEIPRDLPTFAAFIRGCMRREPTDIIVGECRDSETMDAAIQAAISGPCADHDDPRQRRAADDAAHREPLSAGRAGKPDQRGRAVAAAGHQSAPGDARRTASARRCANFWSSTAALRTQFLETDPSQWPSLTRRAVEEQGQSYKVAIENALGAGRITKETAAYELREIG